MSSIYIIFPPLGYIIQVYFSVCRTIIGMYYNIVHILHIVKSVNQQTETDNYTILYYIYISLHIILYFYNLSMNIYYVLCFCLLPNADCIYSMSLYYYVYIKQQNCITNILYLCSKFINH